ncbi:MAG: hypothetical protein ONB25_10525 [candidate division KSB1 bacterium]|nr:hypothetical protein [candidate division KSB1 bacterium]MDZ7412154.1 hypothetical protein [candidate division KSB1 bacterium]
MRKLLSLKTGWALGIFAFLDLICAGLGMGVPIFCILLGLPVGWYIARRITARPFDTKVVLTKTLVGAALTSGFTFLGMMLLWGPWLGMLFDPAADVQKLGAPLILYDPRASFIGWLVLMIVISPFLQLLMTLFGSHLTLLWWISRHGGTSKENTDAA